jgi:thiosulfate/3-mercaptopyruvate sulfurtransferase
VWWLLRWLGHNRAAVLDGGFARWTGEARRLAHGGEHRSRRAFIGAPRGAMVATVDEIERMIGHRPGLLVDARAPERYRGDAEPLDRAAGHIPGAVNYFFQNSLADGRFRSPEELRSRLRAVIGATPPDRLVCYCGSGVTACHNLLALECAGLTGARLYPGSWSEWSSDPKRPVETGDPSCPPRR